MKRKIVVKKIAHLAIVIPLTFSLSLLALFNTAFSENFSNSKIKVWGAKGNDQGKFNEPFAIAVDQSERVYVADARNHRIQIFDQKGKFLGQWGKHGNGPGDFEKPSGIAVNNDGDIFVSDYDLDRIQKFTPQGNFLMQWGTPGKILDSLIHLPG